MREGVDGNVFADISNGPIQPVRERASLTAFAPKGNISSGISDDASATVSGRATGGTITTDFPLAVMDGRLSRKIGDGKSATIELRTMNGDITLTRISERNTENGGSDDE